MNRKKCRTLLLSLLIIGIIPFIQNKAKAESEIIPDGWIAWHSYSDYTSLDSVLYVLSPSGEKSEISGYFINAMNGDFGSTPYDLTFMAIDSSHDEWDIWRANLITGKIINLTENSGFRNEDPKFSPDGKHIVFKRGYWNTETDGFVYNLAEYDLMTGNIRMLTDDLLEESMPYYSEDGTMIYYARLKNGISSIYCLDALTGKTGSVYEEEGINAYYPVVKNSDIYFSKWQSRDNHNDCIMRISDGNIEKMIFNSETINCSDSCPLSDNSIIYSSTESGSYDLFISKGKDKSALNMINTDKNELGAAAFTDNNIDLLIENAKNFMMGTQCSDKNYDADGDRDIDCIDYILIKNALYR